MGNEQRFDAIVIGAGFGGIYALKKLRDDLGLKVRVFDKAGGSRRHLVLE
jgi:cyclohexanone monooxygenase